MAVHHVIVGTVSGANVFSSCYSTTKSGRRAEAAGPALCGAAAQQHPGIRSSIKPDDARFPPLVERRSGSVECFAERTQWPAITG